MRANARAPTPAPGRDVTLDLPLGRTSSGVSGTQQLNASRCRQVPSWHRLQFEGSRLRWIRRGRRPVFVKQPEHAPWSVRKVVSRTVQRDPTTMIQSSVAIDAMTGGIR
jgi:hypothetical protein